MWVALYCFGEFKNPLSQVTWCELVGFLLTISSCWIGSCMKACYVVICWRRWVASTLHTFIFLVNNKNSFINASKKTTRDRAADIQRIINFNLQAGSANEKANKVQCFTYRIHVCMKISLSACASLFYIMRKKS